MATFAGKIRSTGIDNTTMKLNSQGKLVSVGGGMQPFTSRATEQTSVFYADGNILVSGDGKSWQTAFKTLAEGLAACHAFQSSSANRAFAQRATLYCCADNFTEDITKFAEKTDIIGVGSTNQHPRPRIEGTHVLEATTSDTYHGCRWFNVEFYGAAAGIIVDVPADQNGQEFHNCVFSAVDGATIGIRAVQSHDMTIKNCWFDPNTSGTGFATAAVQINAGSVTNFLFEGNRVTSDGIGLDFNPTTGQPINCWAIDNNMHCVGMCIDSEDDTAFTSLAVVGNRMITDIDTTTVTDGYDFVLGMAVDNELTGKDETDSVPYVLQA